VHFDVADLHKLPYPDDTFDAVYCISVLEHSTDYGVIIGEFRRVLKPEGMLIVTFDISLDGTADISPKNAHNLLGNLTEHFITDESPIRNLPSKLGDPGILSTGKIDNPVLLPCRRPWLYAVKYLVICLSKLRLPQGKYPDLTVFCHVFRKAAKD
jgi:ubiquinone/menaquinone biosynthesis C-methylase UbiE